MSTTIDHIEVPEELLQEAMRRARTLEPKAAMLEALRDFTRPRTQADLIKLMGSSDSFLHLRNWNVSETLIHEVDRHELWDSRASTQR